MIAMQGDFNPVGTPQARIKPRSIEDTTEIVAFLLEKELDGIVDPKANVNKYLGGLTPLMKSVLLDNERVIRLLLVKGARLNDTMRFDWEYSHPFDELLDGSTALMMAASRSAIVNTPVETLTTVDDMKKTGWNSNPFIEFVRVNCSKAACEIILRHTRLKSGTSDVEGLKPGEGRISEIMGEEKPQLPIITSMDNGSKRPKI